MMLRLLTYNVHRCVGTDRRLDVGRIAAVIAEYEPDIVCLQELDVGRARTNGVDQATRIAERLAMTSHFHPAMKIEDELYGDAILTALPETLIKVGALPSLRGVRGLEPRGALWVRVQTDDGPLNIVNTHLGLVPREQRNQVAALMGEDWLGGEAIHDPIMLVGDFNATSISRPYKAVTRRLKDVQRVLDQRPSIKTFPSSFPAIRIDHVFISDGVRPISVGAPFSPLARLASDHLPLIVDFELIPIVSES